MVYHNYQEYMEAVKAGARGIKFERLPDDPDEGFIRFEPFSALKDFNESIRNGAA
jgi:hypothetical protein